MKTSDVRIDVKLNKAVWSKGIRNVRFERLSARSAVASGRKGDLTAEAA